MLRTATYIFSFVIFCAEIILAQSTSWTGASSTSWTVAANWSSGVPTSSSDVIIGDASFTGGFQPTLGSTVTINSLTVGGTTSSTLTINNKGTLTVEGDVTINANGTISQNRRAFTVKGDWTNNGTYTTTNSNASFIFAGSSQTIGGTPVSQTFQKVTINAGTTITLASNITIDNTSNVNGTLDPSTYKITNTGTLRFNTGSYLYIKASVLTGASGNFSENPTINAGSTVEFAGSSNQTFTTTTITVSNLIISNPNTVTLGANVTINSGNVTVNNGTLDLSTFTMNRSAAGGVLTLASGTTMRCASTFPANFSTNSLNLSSTVEYYGSGAQTISPQTYGNLKLSTSGTKSSASAITISGNLSTSGTVTFSAGAAVIINGLDSIGSGTTFTTTGAFTHTMYGNIVNSGTITDATGTITLAGNNSTVNGSGTYNINNLTVSGSGITASSSANLTLSGNLATTGSGSFTHTTGGSGTLTMSGTGATISGTGITLNNYTISAGSVSTSSSLTIGGNFSAAGTFTASSGTITLSGGSASISGAGSIAFNALNITGILTTARSFSIASNLSISGSLTATAGTVTFNGTSSLGGTVNLYDVTLNGTSLQLGSGSNLGIAGTLTLSAGTFNVTSTTPNTIDFNGSGAQSVPSTTYHNVSFSTGGTKTASGNLTVNGDFVIGSGTTFVAGALAHAIAGNFTNSGTFSAGSSTITFNGVLDAALSGATTFNTLVINKSSSLNSVMLQNNISVVALTMTTGRMITGSNAVTVSSARTGNGIIIGTITRTHSFSNSTAYEFEGPFNTITFSSGATNITSISVTTTLGTVSDFTFGSSVNRVYNVAVTGSSYNAALRLHYDDTELNGNTETGLELWKYSTSWSTQSKSANDATDNWVELNNLTDVAGRWSLSEFVKVVRWTGAVSTAWENASNWEVISGSPSLPPTTTDVVQIGDSLFTNHPSINSAVSVRSIQFGSDEGVTLTLASGSLTTTGNIDGTWEANQTHSISVGSASLSVGGSLTLGDGTSSHILNLSIGSGTATVSGSLTQTSSSFVVFSGSGTLNIGGNYSYVSGTFTPSTGTVNYNGSTAQTVAALTYRNLTINKSAGTATLTSSATVTNDLTITAGTFATTANIVVSGNISIASGATLSGGSATISIGGNWSNSGTFSSGTGTVNFNGGGDQSISSTTFNHLSINKGSGTATPGANLTVNGNLTISAGTFNLATFTSNRSVLGGTLTIAASATLYVGGSDNFPSNFSTNTISSTSNVEYNGTGTQTVAALTYGNLAFSNGGSNAKTFSGNTTAAGNIVINSGSTVNAGSSTITILGSLTNNGTLTASTSTIQLNGTSKSVTGTISFNSLSVSGSYTANNDITVTGSFTNSGTLTTGSTTVAFSGNVSNNGTITNSGTVTFTGSSSQTIALNNGFTSANPGIVNFNGSSAPTFADGTVPNFYSVTINNSGGISPSIGWTIAGPFTIESGTTFNGGSFTHAFNNTFTNNGSVSSSGILRYSPSSSVTITLPGTSFSSTGTVELAGTGAITLASGVPTINNLTISNTNASGVTLVSGWTIGGDVTIQSNATLNAGTGLSHTMAGNFTANGTFNGGTSTVTFNNTTNKNISSGGALTFYHLAIASSDSVTVVSNISISGNLTNNGIFVNDGVTVSFTGSSNSIIGGAATPFDILAINKTAAITTLAVNISNLSDLTVSSGTLDLATLTATDNSTDGGTLTLAAGTTLKIGGTSPTTFDAFSFGSTSTVEYTGSGQTVNVAPTYGNLTVSTSGATTISSSTYTIAGNFTVNSGTLSAGNGTVLNITGNYSQSGGTFSGGTGSTFNIAGNFSLSSGTFTPSTSATTHSVGGTWTMTGGTFTNTNTSIRFNGTGTQTVSSTGNFNSVTINKSSGTVSLSSNITIGGTLTLTSGNIVSNSFTVILSSTGSVSRTSGHIVGNLQKNVATGTPTRTFEIGDASKYSPVSLTFASVTVAGNLIATTSSGDHSDVLNSGINPNKSVNRYWTLTNSGITFTTYSATFTFVAGDLDAGATTSSFNVSKRTSGTWAVQTIGTRTATTTQASGISAFGDFQIGESGKVWNGSVDNNWTTAGNWTPSGEPSSIDAVTIGGAFTVNINTAATTADLSIGNASLVVTVQTGNSLTVSGNLTMSSGTLNIEAAFPTVTGTSSLSGGTVSYTGTGAQSIAAQNYYSLTVSGARTGNSITFPADTVGIASSFTYSATFTTGNTVITENTIEYNGTGGQTVIPFSYHNLLISGSRSDSVKFDSSATISVAGTLNPNSTFSSGTYSLKGSTLDFNAAGAQTIPALNYNNLTISGARSNNTITFSSSDTIGISGTFNPAATSVSSYSQSSVIFEFNGTSAQAIPAFTYNSLVFSGAGTKTISSSITSSNNFVNQSGSSINIGNVTVQVNGSLNNAGTIFNDGTVITGN